MYPEVVVQLDGVLHIPGPGLTVLSSAKCKRNWVNTVNWLLNSLLTCWRESTNHRICPDVVFQLGGGSHIPGPWPTVLFATKCKKNG